MFSFLYKRKKHKYINGTKGVISLFLAILMVPFTMIIGYLINAARINSAVAIFDEALCNASNSTLGTYDSFLRKRFGLLAMKQDLTGKGPGYSVENLISDTFEAYMKENAKALGVEFVEGSLDVDAKGVFSLADPRVLLYEIMEYSKYQVPLTLIEQTLDFDSLLKALKISIPDTTALRFISEGLGAMDSAKKLADSYDKFKEYVKRLEEAVYGEYSGTTLVTEGMSQKYDTFISKLTEYNDAEKNIKDDIEEYKNTKIPNQEEVVKKAKAAMDSASQANKAKKTEEYNNEVLKLNTLKSELSALESPDALQTYKDAATKARDDYSKSIGTVYSALSSVNDKLIAVKEALAEMSSMLTTAITETAGGIAKSQTEKIKGNTKELQDDIRQSDNQTEIDAKTWGVELLQDQQTKIDNMNTMAKTASKSIDSAVSSGKIDLNVYAKTSGPYATAMNTMQTLQNKVKNLDVTSSSDRNNASSSYIDPFTLDGILTYKEAEDYEAELVGELAKSSVLGLLKALINFFDALFSITVFYDPQLGAVLDTNYYNTTYGGLPSEKDRSKYPLYYGEADDATASEEYKTLFGGYSVDDGTNSNAVDLMATLRTIKDNFSTIGDNLDDLFSWKVLYKFASIFSNIKEAISNIFNAITTLVKNIATVVATSLRNKMLVSGYVNYMCANRTTYNDKAMNGASFSTDKTNPSTISKNPVFGIVSLFDTISKGVTGTGDRKCFVGAEMEYIMVGSSSELLNQLTVFAEVYVLRLVLDIIPIFCNSEVNEIAGACGPFCWVAYLLFIVLEPLADTILLVNGSDSVSLVNNTIYFAPSGIAYFVQDLAALEISRTKLDSITADYMKETNSATGKNLFDSSHASDTNAFSSESGLLDADYTKHLLLLSSIFVKQETMISRMGDIIEMEAVLNGKGAKFDLDKAYMAIRASGSFKTGEFIKMSESGVLTLNKKRVIYRSY